MNPTVALRAQDPGGELAALVETLHETGRRLEELTGGEVDSVMDRDGRVFMLRHAQEQLRASDAVRQADILDSLPAHIALLDNSGRIVSVNSAWRKFADANGLPGPAHGVGLDYLATCDAAAGDGAEGAAAVAAGIRAVLLGGEPFALEYPCHSPDQARWFHMTATPLAGGHQGGAVVAHANITKRKLATKALRSSVDDVSHSNRAALESERRFTDMLGNVELAAVMVDREGLVTYCNEYLLRLVGWRLEEVLGRNWFDFLSARAPEIRKGFLAALLTGEPGTRHDESEIVTRGGERRLIRWNNSLLRSGSGEVIGVAGIGEDITEQKRAELHITRLNRVYAVLSGINTLIVRVRDREELFRGACRIAVDEGGFRMAMIAQAEAGGHVRVMASEGKDEAIKALVGRALASPQRSASTMVARALGQKTAVVSLDSREDPQLAFGKEYAEAGVRSVAVFPIIVADEARGVLALYSTEPGFFDAEEMRLLTELAGDIAYAIDHIEKQELIDYVAYYDPLTGLANRTLFLERVDTSLRGAAAGGHGLALFLVDVERFKNINDSLGRPAGDALLKQVALWLSGVAGDAALVSRLGADHFAMMLPQVRAGGDLGRLVEKVTSSFLEHTFRLDDAVFRLAVKVGAAVFPGDGADAETLFRNAEAALKMAKATGERYLFHTSRMTNAVAGKLTLETQLRQAVDRGEFVLHYQPKVRLDDGKLTGAEALIRWNDPITGLVPPGRFIPILEETGLIYEVGRWALRRAVDDYLRWRSAGLPAVRVAVNVSPLQLRSRGFVAEIEALLDIHASAAEGLELEITESLIMEDVRHSIASLRAIRALGVRVAIDDFGTGFSSLSYLARLPVDALKIDRSFVVDMTAGPQGLALVSTIIGLAHSLKLGVVAEGVETEEQSRLLGLLGCDEMQGFLFSRPVPAERFELDFLAPSADRPHAALAQAPP